MKFSKINPDPANPKTTVIHVVIESPFIEKRLSPVQTRNVDLLANSVEIKNEK
jgi:hypothetical protein